MQSKYRLTAAFMAALIISSLQIPSSAQMPESLVMASGMTKTQLTALGKSFDQSMASAMDLGKSTTVTTNTTVTVNLSANNRYKCAKGGYIDSTMALRTVVIKATGNATIAGAGRQVITGWKCLPGWTVTSNPYLTYKITGTIIKGVTKMAGSTTGSWKSTGTSNAKQSCQVNGSTSYAADGKTGLVSYTITCVPGGTTVIKERF